jgi:hypothetical protein
MRRQRSGSHSSHCARRSGSHTNSDAPVGIPLSPFDRFVTVESLAKVLRPYSLMAGKAKTDRRHFGEEAERTNERGQVPTVWRGLR